MAQSVDTPGAVIELSDGAADWPVMLASDADREAIAGQLSSAFAEGRLTVAEHADRVRAAYGARTLGELAGLTADLPGPGRDAGRQQALGPAAMDRCLLSALVFCCRPAGLLAARRRARAGGGAGAADR